jgi:hypothetical protein
MARAARSAGSVVRFSICRIWDLWARSMPTSSLVQAVAVAVALFGGLGLAGGDLLDEQSGISFTA